MPSSCRAGHPTAGGGIRKGRRHQAKVGVGERSPRAAGANASPDSRFDPRELGRWVATDEGRSARSVDQWGSASHPQDLVERDPGDADGGYAPKDASGRPGGTR